MKESDIKGLVKMKEDYELRLKQPKTARDF
jgi:hypothetical protein